MAEQAVAVVDTNVLLNLATPVVDGRPHAPSGADPLKALLTGYDAHIPASVLGEVTDATGSDDLLSAAADLVLKTAHQLTATATATTFPASSTRSVTSGAISSMFSNPSSTLVTRSRRLSVASNSMRSPTRTD